MDYITRDQARREIVSLNLPQIVLDIFDSRPLPHDLDFRFSTPYAIFALGPKEQAHYGHGRISPLWMNDGGYTVVAYHHAPERRGFFRFDIESRAEEEPVALSWQQVLVKEFKFLWESDWTDEDLIEAAVRFDFKHIHVLIAELSHAKLDTFEKDRVWYERFLANVRQP